jgi:hypothetical protein
MPLPFKGTRLEQARAMETPVTSPDPGHSGGDHVDTIAPAAGATLVTLAAVANEHVFDVDEPTDDEVAAFWADVETARRRLRDRQGFWQRLRGDVSLRTFRDHLPTGAGLAPAVQRTSRSQAARPKKGDT